MTELSSSLPLPAAAGGEEGEEGEGEREEEEGDGAGSPGSPSASRFSAPPIRSAVLKSMFPEVRGGRGEGGGKGMRCSMLYGIHRSSS